jgi:hypothetical protein
MYDQSFNAKSLERQIRKSDFTKLKQLRDANYRSQQLAQACQRANSGFGNFDSIKLSKIRSKTVCKVTKYSDELIIRKINNNLIELAKIKHIDRDSIVESIKSMLKEGTEYRIYRLDIKSFYESIQPTTAIEKMEEIKQLSLPTKRYIKEILSAFTATGNTGLPRGLSISATLAELLMRDLDEKIRKDSGVYFYSRYVDDIIIITNGSENKKKFLRLIKNSLPAGLSLNSQKQTTKERAALHKDKFSQYFIHNSSPYIEFEFLGYSFRITDPDRDHKKTPRKVTLDIAHSKVNKIKTRIIKSLLDFNKNKDMQLLDRRISFLCTNFSIIDSDRDRKRLAGIHHNYHQVDLETSKALPELDKFLSKIISSGQGTVCDSFFILTSNTERRRLLRWSFIRGFGEKKYLNFSKKNLSEIQRCWVYV